MTVIEFARVALLALCYQFQSALDACQGNIPCVFRLAKSYSGRFGGQRCPPLPVLTKDEETGT